MADTADETPGSGLPPDGHVHTEWSWDTVVGSMEDSCARAVALGLPTIAFTEHADLTPWTTPAEIAPSLPEHFRVRLRSDGVLQPPDLDVEGYLACVQRCRERFPGLRPLSGVELSEPHWHPDRAKDLLRAGSFQRVLGAVHALPIDNGCVEVSTAGRPSASAATHTTRWASREALPRPRQWPSPAGSVPAARRTTCGPGATALHGESPTGDLSALGADSASSISGTRGPATAAIRSP